MVQLYEVGQLAICPHGWRLNEYGCNSQNAQQRRAQLMANRTPEGFAQVLVLRTRSNMTTASASTASIPTVMGSVLPGSSEL
jgi:hypothetical protein